MFERDYRNPKYKIVSRDRCGLFLGLLRYGKTGIEIGRKSRAVQKGLKPKGRENFYSLPDGTVVIDGFLAEPLKENRVEVRLKSKLVLTKENWEEIKKEIDFLLNYGE